ncbi:hypothetical protein B0H12DRAFT_1078824 [Mycena haematopus]|nr:hypothetical protein B0H12DRAFT_1078824 [Mycena haematopus]
MAKNKWEGMLRHLFHATEATAGEYGLRKSGWRAGSGGGPKQKLGRISVFEGWKRAPLLALPIQQRQIKNGKVPKKAGPPPPLRALDDAAVARASAHAPAAASCYWNSCERRPAGGRARAMGSALGNLLRVGDGSERVAERTGAGGAQAKPTTHYRAKTGRRVGKRESRRGREESYLGISERLVSRTPEEGERKPRDRNANVDYEFWAAARGDPREDALGRWAPRWGIFSEWETALSA